MSVCVCVSVFVYVCVCVFVCVRVFVYVCVFFLSLVYYHNNVPYPDVLRREARTTTKILLRSKVGIELRKWCHLSDVYE